MYRKRGVARRFVKCAVGVVLCVGLAVGGLALPALSASSARFGETTITLVSQKYYRNGDYTRLVYQVKSSPHDPPEAWILGAGDCVLESAFLWGSSGDFQWVESPVRGLRFSPSLKNEKVYLYLAGQWSLEPVDVAVLSAPGLPQGEWAFGSIDGPSCGDVSIGLEIVEGENVSFTPIVAPATYSSESGSLLRVSSGSADWVLDYGIESTVPKGASVATVERVFRLTLDNYTPDRGITDIGVDYELDIAPEDFEGLPEGTYVIRITFTIAAN
jgi:hypothetical protein